MRKGHNHEGLFVDTGLLRDHVSKLQKQRKIAERLRESLQAMRNLSDPEAFGKYSSVLRDVDQLCEYLTRMARLLDNTGDEAVQLSQEIGRLIQEDADYTRHIAEKAIML